MAEFNRNWRFG